MSLHQRVSANTGRRAQERPSVQFGASHYHRSSAPVTHPPQVATDYDERLLDALNQAHTELNKANSERDRFQNLYEQSTKKLTEVNHAHTELKSQLQGFKDNNAALKERLQELKDENERLGYDNETLGQDYGDLKTKYNAVTVQLNTINSSPTFTTSTSSGTGNLPERPKVSRSVSKKDHHREHKEHKEHKEHRDHKDHKDHKEHRDDRGRTREKDKEKEKREQKAEKERLSKRFEERRPPTSGGRRSSFIEGWGPGGRSTSSAPASTRTYTNVASGHVQVPAVTSHKATYSNVPRTAANPLSPRIYNGVGGSSSGYSDEDGVFEDGNYHAYPIPR